MRLAWISLSSLLRPGWDVVSFDTKSSFYSCPLGGPPRAKLVSATAGQIWGRSGEEFPGSVAKQWDEFLSKEVVFPLRRSESLSKSPPPQPPHHMCTPIFPTPPPSVQGRSMTNSVSCSLPLIPEKAMSPEGTRQLNPPKKLPRRDARSNASMFPHLCSMCSSVEIAGQKQWILAYMGIWF